MRHIPVCELPETLEDRQRQKYVERRARASGSSGRVFGSHGFVQYSRPGRYNRSANFTL